MLGKLVKVAALTTIELLAALEDADCPLESGLHSFIYFGRVEKTHRR